MSTDVTELDARFFELSLDMLCMVRFDGRFARLSPAWERTLGFTLQELYARPMIELVHPEDRERTLEQNRRVRAGGQARLFENRYLCRDGSYRWLLWNATADLDLQVIFSVARDITERKAAEQERERLVSELQTALAELGELRRILPICSYCKKIRDDANYWHTVEAYLSRHASTRFSHSICPGCFESIVQPQLDEIGG